MLCSKPFVEVSSFGELIPSLHTTVQLTADLPPTAQDRGQRTSFPWAVGT